MQRWPTFWLLCLSPWYFTWSTDSPSTFRESITSECAKFTHHHIVNNFCTSFIRQLETTIDQKANGSRMHERHHQNSRAKHFAGSRGRDLHESSNERRTVLRRVRQCGDHVCHDKKLRFANRWIGWHGKEYSRYFESHHLWFRWEIAVENGPIEVGENQSVWMDVYGGVRIESGS